jgi:DedD protein
MPLPSFFQRFRRGGQAAAASDLNAMPPMDLEVARTRARRRLVGMLVLVVAGVVGFPWLFETQPRPMSQDVQITQAPGAGGSAAVAAADRLPARGVSGRVGVAAINPPVVTGGDAPADVDGGNPGREAGVIDEAVSAEDKAGNKADAKPQAKPTETHVAQAKPAVSALTGDHPANKPADKGNDKPADKAADKKPSAAKPAEHKASERKPDAKPADKGADKKPADKKPADTKTADKKDQRYVVQFGAFADATSAQAARTKVEKLGIKTYAQQVDTPAGKRTRVRVGPFADKAEADKANAALRKAGMAGSVLTL